MYSGQSKGVSLYQVLVNECKVYGSTAPVEMELNELQHLENQGEMEMARQLLQQAVQKLSGGENTVLYDEANIPSIMVRIPAMTCGELLAGCDAAGLHPAFRCGSRPIREIWVSKYINHVVDGHAASLPMAAPSHVHNQREAVRYVQCKGPGWMLMPFQLRMAIVLKCLQQGIYPSGNTDRGHDYYAQDQIGIMTAEGTALTGSGPLAWTHNGQPSGLWDLSGNLNEWDGGFRLVDGEIQLMDVAALLCPEEKQNAWYALDEAARPVMPGTENTLHFDGTDGTVRLTKRVEHTGLGNCAFCDVSAAEDVQVPELLKLIGLYPSRAGLPETAGWRWINTEGEARPLCGGAYRIKDHSGMFFVGVTKSQDVEYPLSGMRCIYIAPDAMEEESK